MKQATIDIEMKKNKAIELLKQLDIYKPYIKGFEENNHVCFYERFGGYWVYQEPEIEAKMKEIDRNITVKFTLLHTNTRISANVTVSYL